MFLNITLILLGFVLLVIGAGWLVTGSSGIAKRLNISEIIIGLTIVSIGTSMPELVVSITSALQGYSDMAIGNVIGSNLSNLLLILGLSTIIKPVAFQKQTITYEIPMCLLFTIVFIVFCNTESQISKIESTVLLVLFLIFIVYTIFIGKKQSEKNEEKVIEKNENESRHILKDIFLIIIGIVGLKYGGDLAVNNAVNVAKYFNLSEKIISLTILAIGTSLPELATSVTAAIKGNSDIAIGNIVGSNMFNILLIVGICSAIKPITYNFAYNFDLKILISSTFMLWIFPFIPPKKEMSRSNGIVYFLMYVIYMGVLFTI